MLMYNALALTELQSTIIISLNLSITEVDRQLESELGRTNAKVLGSLSNGSRALTVVPDEAVRFE